MRSAFLVALGVSLALAQAAHAQDVEQAAEPSCPAPPDSGPTLNYAAHRSCRRKAAAGHGVYALVRERDPREVMRRMFAALAEAGLPRRALATRLRQTFAWLACPR